MREGFSNKRKAGNLLTAAITTLSSLSMGEHTNLWGHTCILYYVGVAPQSFMFQSPGTGPFKTLDQGLENAWDAYPTSFW